MKILVDTNIVIDYLRVANKSATVYETIFKDPTRVAAISFVTVIELYAGSSMKKRENEKIVEDLLDHAEIVESHMEIYKKAGEIIRTYGLQFQDAVIASQAHYYDLPLLTFNKKDFQRIKEIKLF